MLWWEYFCLIAHYASLQLIKAYVTKWRQVSQKDSKRAHKPASTAGPCPPDKLHLWKLQLPDYLTAPAPTH